MRKRTQRRRVAVRHRKEPYGRIVAQRPAIPRTSISAVRPEAFREEVEAERLVTRICDSILSRLNGNEARDDETQAQRPRRRTH